MRRVRASAWVTKGTYEVMARLLLDLLEKLLLVESMGLCMSTLTVLIALSHQVSLSVSNLIWECNCRSTSVTWGGVWHRLLRELHHTNFAWYFLHSKSMLIKASSPMWIWAVDHMAILIRHMSSIVEIVSALVVKRPIIILPIISLWYQMSPSHLRSLPTITTTTVFTYIIHSLWLLVHFFAVLNGWDVWGGSLWAHAIVFHDVVVIWGFRFIAFSHHGILIIKSILLWNFKGLRYISFHLLSLFLLRNHIALLFTGSLTLVMLFFFFDHKLILSALFLLL